MNEHRQCTMNVVYSNDGITLLSFICRLKISATYKRNVQCTCECMRTGKCKENPHTKQKCHRKIGTIRRHKPTRTHPHTLKKTKANFVQLKHRNMSLVGDCARNYLANIQTRVFVSIPLLIMDNNNNNGPKVNILLQLVYCTIKNDCGALFWQYRCVPLKFPDPMLFFVFGNGLRDGGDLGIREYNRTQPDRKIQKKNGSKTRWPHQFVSGDLRCKHRETTSLSPESQMNERWICTDKNRPIGMRHTYTHTHTQVHWYGARPDTFVVGKRCMQRIDEILRKPRICVRGKILRSIKRNVWEIQMEKHRPNVSSFFKAFIWCDVRFWCATPEPLHYLLFIVVDCIGWICTDHIRAVCI